jgi:phytoene synthase
MEIAETRIRVALVSPRDVVKERAAAKRAVDELNGTAARGRLVPWRWTGRIYHPAEDLRRLGVTKDDLARRSTTAAARGLVRYEMQLTRELFAYAAGGIRMLDRSSRACIETAYTLDGGILEAVEAAPYEIFDRRVRVGMTDRLRVVLAAHSRAWSTWRQCA